MREKLLANKISPLLKIMLIFLGFGGLGFFLYSANNIVANKLNEYQSNKEKSQKYLLLNQKDISTYDPYIDRKTFLPLGKHQGFLVSLGKVSHEAFLEIVFGGEYTLDFINDNTTIAQAVIAPDVGYVFRMVVSVPEDAVQTGYDQILFTPKSGNTFFLSYLSTINSAEENRIFHPKKPRPPKSYHLEGSYLQNGTPYLIQGLYAYISSIDKGTLNILVLSLSSELESELLYISDGKGVLIGKFAEGSLVPKSNGEVNYLSFSIALENEIRNKADIHLFYQYVGGDEIKSVEINPFAPFNEEVRAGTEIRKRDNIKDFPQINVTDNILSFSEEKTVLSESLFIPEGYRVTLNAGQTIDLRNNAFIVSRSPIFAYGTADAPILITSTDNSLYSGFVVIQAAGRSNLNHVVFDNLGEVNSGIYHLTGSVTFYESNCDFDFCQFLNNRSEDGLNTIRSDVNVANSRFYNTYQDAYDADFCTGLFDKVHFERTGNDAFDISGSRMKVHQCTFADIHDKAASVGERSTLEIDGLYAERVQIGIGAKDDSTIFAKDVTVKDAFIGFCSYQKKPEYGPSRITVNGYKLINPIDFKYLIEKPDTLIVDGERWFASDKKKQALIIKKMINEEPIK